MVDICITRETNRYLMKMGSGTDSMASGIKAYLSIVSGRGDSIFYFHCPI